MQAGNNRHGYCKIYYFCSFRLIVMLDEKRARFARPNGRRGARSFSIGVNECTFFSFLSLSLPPREIVIVHLDSLASFLYPRPRLFRSYRFGIFRSTPRRRDSSSDRPYTNYVFKNGKINVILDRKWKIRVVPSAASSLSNFQIYLRYFLMTKIGDVAKLIVIRDVTLNS